VIYFIVYIYIYFIKVNLKSKDFAVVSRSSVNSPLGSAIQFQSPFFVFEQQVSYKDK